MKWKARELQRFVIVSSRKEALSRVPFPIFYTTTDGIYTELLLKREINQYKKGLLKKMFLFN